MSSYLELFIGPMYASKTTSLLEVYKKCLFCDISVSIINHSLDTRYHESLISTHDNIMAPCIQTDKLSNVWKDDTKLLNSDVILINEGQFFLDLYEVVVDMLNHNKKVYISGLDGDFERKKIGYILDLIPLCDKVTKLTSLCSLCKDGTAGIFSMRLTNETAQIVIGSNNYIPVCRNCFSNNINHR